MIGLRGARLIVAAGRSGFCASLLGCLAAATAAHAQVPSEFLGTWSNNPPRCEQVNGEVDLLTVTKSAFDFYEIGCTLARPVRSPNAVRFAARCSKGGIPESSGTVVMRRLAPDKIDVALLGFSWIVREPQAFRRCRPR